jgi:hypothetical protein
MLTDSNLVKRRRLDAAQIELLVFKMLFVEPLRSMIGGIHRAELWVSKLDVLGDPLEAMTLLAVSSISCRRPGYFLFSD